MVLHVFYFSFRWGPLVHSLGIVQWNSTRRDHPGDPGGVSGSGPVIRCFPLIQIPWAASFLKGQIGPSFWACL